MALPLPLSNSSGSNVRKRKATELPAPASAPGGLGPVTIADTDTATASQVRPGIYGLVNTTNAALARKSRKQTTPSRVARLVHSNIVPVPNTPPSIASTVVYQTHDILVLNRRLPTATTTATSTATATANTAATASASASATDSATASVTTTDGSLSLRPHGSFALAQVTRQVTQHEINLGQIPVLMLCPVSPDTKLSQVIERDVLSRCFAGTSNSAQALQEARVNLLQFESLEPRLLDLDVWEVCKILMNVVQSRRLISEPRMFLLTDTDVAMATAVADRRYCCGVRGTQLDESLSLKRFLDALKFDFNVSVFPDRQISEARKSASTAAEAAAAAEAKKLGKQQARRQKKMDSILAKLETTPWACPRSTHAKKRNSIGYAAFSSAANNAEILPVEAPRPPDSAPPPSAVADAVAGASASASASASAAAGGGATATGASVETQMQAMPNISQSVMLSDSPAVSTTAVSTSSASAEAGTEAPTSNMLNSAQTDGVVICEADREASNNTGLAQCTCFRDGFSKPDTLKKFHAAMASLDQAQRKSIIKSMLFTLVYPRSTDFDGTTHALANRTHGSTASSPRSRNSTMYMMFGRKLCNRAFAELVGVRINTLSAYVIELEKQDWLPGFDTYRSDYGQNRKSKSHHRSRTLADSFVKERAYQQGYPIASELDTPSLLPSDSVTVLHRQYANAWSHRIVADDKKATTPQSKSLAYSTFAGVVGSGSVVRTIENHMTMCDVCAYREPVSVAALNHHCELATRQALIYSGQLSLAAHTDGVQHISFDFATPVGIPMIPQATSSSSPSSSSSLPSAPSAPSASSSASSSSAAAVAAALPSLSQASAAQLCTRLHSHMFVVCDEAAATHNVYLTPETRAPLRNFNQNPDAVVSQLHHWLVNSTSGVGGGDNKSIDSSGASAATATTAAAAAAVSGTSSSPPSSSSSSSTAGTPQAAMSSLTHSDKHTLLMHCGRSSGHVKNDTVIQYMLFLAALGIRRHVMLSFLQPGHNKTFVDACAGSVKFALNQHDLSSFNQLFESAASATPLNVTVHKGLQLQFFIWSTFLSQFFLSTESVNADLSGAYHIATSSASPGSLIVTKDANSAPVVYHMLNPNVTLVQLRNAFHGMQFAPFRCLADYEIDSRQVAPSSTIDADRLKILKSINGPLPFLRSPTGGTIDQVHQELGMTDDDIAELLSKCAM
jgi:hypothetical protein